MGDDINPTYAPIDSHSPKMTSASEERGMVSSTKAQIYSASIRLTLRIRQKVSMTATISASTAIVTWIADTSNAFPISIAGPAMLLKTAANRYAVMIVADTDFRRNPNHTEMIPIAEDTMEKMTVILIVLAIRPGDNTPSITNGDRNSDRKKIPNRIALQKSWASATNEDVSTTFANNSLSRTTG